MSRGDSILHTASIAALVEVVLSAATVTDHIMVQSVSASRDAANVCRYLLAVSIRSFMH
jgi:hypothetical protein